MEHHKHFFRRKWPWIALSICVLATIVYGGYLLITVQKENDRLRSTITRLQESINSLKGNLSLTEYERDKLNSALEISKIQTEILETQTEELNEKVDDFEKLQSLDPELLKRYSKVYFLNENYKPSELVQIDNKYVNGVDRKLEIHDQVWPYLKEMLDDSTDEGLSLLVTSAYRSFGTQAVLKANYRVIYGAGTANQFSADQGYSEHQLGTTVDLTTSKMGGLSSTFDATAEYKWLTEHAHEYGFVLSYPKGNKYYIYEPWHWRFVGVDLATKLYEEGLTLYGMEQREIDEYLIKIFD